MVGATLDISGPGAAGTARGPAPRAGLDAPPIVSQPRVVSVAGDGLRLIAAGFWCRPEQIAPSLTQLVAALSQLASETRRRCCLPSCRRAQLPRHRATDDPGGPFVFRFSASAEHLELLGAVIAIDLIANLALFSAIRTGSLGWVLPAASLVPAFALLAAVPLFPGQIQFAVVAGALIVVASVFLLQATDRFPAGEAQADLPPADRSPNRKPVALTCALASAALFGVSSNLSKLLLQGHDAATNPFSLYFLRAWGIGMVAGFVVGSRAGFGFRLPLRAVTIRAVFVIGQWLLFLTALQTGNIVAVSAAANTTPVFSVVRLRRRTEPSSEHLRFSSRRRTH
jgi:drug/metabolite transporter (DMT)-like permease